jgi:hypothetical protein
MRTLAAHPGRLGVEPATDQRPIDVLANWRRWRHHGAMPRLRITDVPEQMGLVERVELVSDELDVVEQDRLEHRFLFFPEGEFGVRFREVTAEVAPVIPADRHQ